MPNHCKPGEQGYGTSRRHALDRSIVASLRSAVLDTGDTDEFTFAAAGGIACSCGVRSQAETTGAL